MVSKYQDQRVVSTYIKDGMCSWKMLVFVLLFSKNLWIDHLFRLFVA